MFKVGDKVLMPGYRNVLTVIETDSDKRTLVEFSDKERKWFYSELLSKASKREVEITIKVEISDGVKYVAVDKNGSIYEYASECRKYEDEGAFSGYIPRRLDVKNWRETKTKVGD